MNGDNSHTALGKMYKISIICFIFLLAEIIGGFLANSIAIISDAAHMLSDLLGFIISIVSIKISQKKPSKAYTFGYNRAEVLGALLSIALIWIMTGFLLKEAFNRIVSVNVIDSRIMLFTAIFGLFCNIIMIKILHSDDVCCLNRNMLIIMAVFIQIKKCLT
jgi:zinc transporter 2